MSSRVFWSVDGIDPSVRDRAEALARRAGMSLGDWLESTLGARRADTRAPDFEDLEPRPAPVSRDLAEIAGIKERLTAIARQIEQIAPRRSDASRDQGVARQLGDAISRLNAQLAQSDGPAPPRQAREARTRELDARANGAPKAPDPRNSTHRTSPPPAALQSATADPVARSRDHVDPAPRPLPVRVAAQAAPPSPQGPDQACLARHLAQNEGQGEALDQGDGIAQSIAAVRGELAGIRNTIRDALPRTAAIESLEAEIRSLGRRIDDGRQSAADDEGLAGIARTLSEIREMLRALAPAGQLAGQDAAIRSLSAKLDTILRASDDPETVQPLENAIAVLRAIVSNVASNEALARLSEDVQLLSSKIDQSTRSSEAGDPFAAIEARIAALAAALEGRESAPFDARAPQLEDALRTLAARIDRLSVDHDATFPDLKRRVSQLVERLEASAEGHGGSLSRVENMLQEIQRHLERQHATVARLSDTMQRETEPQDGAVIDRLTRDLSDIRLGQSETGRHTKDSLESVNTTLGHLVDRLTVIERDLRTMRPAPPPLTAGPPGPDEAPPSQPGPPVTAPQSAFVAAPRTLQTPTPPAAPEPARPPGEPPSSPLAIELPPDHPLEPGIRPAGLGAARGGPEPVDGDIPAAFRPPVSSSSFIAAARRAAQAAAAAQADPDKARAASRSAGGAHGGTRSSLSSRLRAALAAATVAMIVLGALQPVRSLLQGRATPQAPSVESAREPAHDVAPATTSPDPRGHRSASAPLQPNASADSPDASDITGAIAQPPPRTPSPIRIPAGESLPEAIGGPKLRAAALDGDPAAAYAVALRFAEGSGGAINFEEAAKWYARAARAGLIPATFRLGTLYEKGLGVKRDVDAARRFYVEAAERGNAKAMHNLALLDADGSDKGPDYRHAAQWFLKAAEHGLADSQFNLGVLYARGVGVAQSFSESFKWLSLAAAQGDADAARKRDDVASRMQAPSLAAAKREIERFVAEAQPDDAVQVPAPPGGWDAAATIKPPAATPAPTVHASR